MTAESATGSTPEPEETAPAVTSEEAQSFDALLSSFASERTAHDKRYADLAASTNYSRSLEKAAAEYLADPEDFNPGDLVTWKTQLKNRRFPAYGRPAVVIETVVGRTVKAEETSRITIEEPIDLTLGIIDGNGDFMLYHYDRRRFTMWKPSMTE
jgi:hypothetical protein